MNETLVELENDAERLVQRKQTEKFKIEKLLEELRQTAELHIPSENKAFHNKFNRIKVSLNAIFCTFDEFECVWSEAREQSLLSDTIQTSEFSSEKILALPVTKIDAEAQTDIVIIQEEDLNEIFIPGDSQISPTSPRDLNESVIDWRSLVTENNEELEYLSLKTERDATEDFTPENILETLATDSRGNSGSNSPVNIPIEEIESTDNQNNSNNEEAEKSKETSENSQNKEQQEQEKAPEPTKSAEKDDCKSSRRSVRSSTRSSTHHSHIESKQRKSMPNLPSRKSATSTTENQKIPMKGSSELKKYRKGYGKARKSKENEEVFTGPPKKKIKNLLETIEKIRGTRDNSYETSLGDAVTTAKQIRNEKTLQEKSPKEIAFETMVMQNAIKFYRENFQL